MVKGSNFGLCSGGQDILDNMGDGEDGTIAMQDGPIFTEENVGPNVALGIRFSDEA